MSITNNNNMLSLLKEEKQKKMFFGQRITICNSDYNQPQHSTHTKTIMPQPKQGPSFNERATKSFSNLKNSIQTKWQNLNFGGTKRIASPSSTVFPVEKPSTTSFYIPAQSPDNYVTIPEYSTSPQIPQQIEERRRIKSILKKPKDNTKYSVITPSMCREAQQPIPRWQWNIREKSPYERVIEDRVEREENCVQGKLVAVERLVRTTTTTSKNASNQQQNIYWPGTGLNRTFI
uniref:Uncharacterized protein n=1 Tax=Meloidogyne incognita TaxID=6306 RepID=A0A914LFL9_MELIC